MTQSKPSLDADLIRSLAEILKETDLSEIEIERKDFRIRVARNMTVSAQVAMAPAHLPVMSAPPLVEGPIAPNPNAVASPMVGTAYLSPAPDKPPFVTLGSKVRRGQTLLVIEAMKTFNEIPAPRDGVISDILVESGHPVEFGQPLIVIS